MVLLQNLTSDCSTAANLAALEKWLGMSGLLIPQALLEPDEHQSSLQLVPAVNAANNIINAREQVCELESAEMLMACVKECNFSAALFPPQNRGTGTALRKHPRDENATAGGNGAFIPDPVVQVLTLSSLMSE